MATLTRSELYNLINSNLPDNVSKLIDPAEHRDVLYNIVDSMTNIINDRDKRSLTYWNSAISYIAGECVVGDGDNGADGVIYICIVSLTNAGNFDTEQWQAISTYIPDAETLDYIETTNGLVLSDGDILITDLNINLNTLKSGFYRVETDNNLLVGTDNYYPEFGSGNLTVLCGDTTTYFYTNKDSANFYYRSGSGEWQLIITPSNISNYTTAVVDSNVAITSYNFPEDNLKEILDNTVMPVPYNNIYLDDKIAGWRESTSSDTIALYWDYSVLRQDILDEVQKNAIDADAIPFSNALYESTSIAAALIEIHQDFNESTSAIWNEIDTINTELTDIMASENTVESATSATELSAALALDTDNLIINVTEDITGLDILNVTARNVIIIGNLLEFDSSITLNALSSAINITFLNKVAINKDVSTNDCYIITMNTSGQAVTLNFRDFISERIINFTNIGSGTLDIDFSQDKIYGTATNTTVVTGTRKLESDSMVYNLESKQSNNIIHSQISEAGDFVSTAYLTWEKGESGTCSLVEQNSNLLITMDSIEFIFLGADEAQSVDTYIGGTITLPRFIGDSTALSQSVGGATKGERYSYRVNTGTGSTQYLTSANSAIDLSTGDLIIEYSNSQVNTANRCWYAVIIKGKCSHKASNWITI